MHILALDLATVTGWARGDHDSIPSSGAVAFGNAKARDSEVFAAGLEFLDGLLRTPPAVDVLILEEMLPPTARIKSTTEVRNRLAGLHGIALAVAHRALIPDIRAVSVGKARDHFIGTRILKRKTAKAMVMEMCRRQGWTVVDDNAADACALFSYARSIANPRLALAVTPLFGPRL